MVSPVWSQQRLACPADVPSWTADAQEQAYEEIGRGTNLPVPRNVRLDPHGAPPEIGRWGELLVHNYLVQQQEGERSAKFILPPVMSDVRYA